MGIVSIFRAACSMIELLSDSISPASFIVTNLLQIPFRVFIRTIDDKGDDRHILFSCRSILVLLEKTRFRSVAILEDSEMLYSI